MKQMVIWLVIKLLIKSPKIHSKIIQTQLKMRMIKKYSKKHLKNGIHLQKKDRKLLMIQD